MSLRSGRLKGILFIAALLAVLLVVALSRHLEKDTTPSTMGDFVHIYVRKGLSIVAFALVGYALAAFRRRPKSDTAAIALIVGGYSALIEVAQRLHGEHEGLYGNAVDTLCGVIGGALGSWLYSCAFFQTKPRIRDSPTRDRKNSQ